MYKKNARPKPIKPKPIKTILSNPLPPVLFQAGTARGLIGLKKFIASEPMDPGPRSGPAAHADILA